MADTAKNRLTKWFEKEKKENNLLDVKFFPGDTSKTNVESFCQSVLDILEAKKRGNFERLAESP